MKKRIVLMSFVVLCVLLLSACLADTDSGITDTESDTLDTSSQNSDTADDNVSDNENTTDTNIYVTYYRYNEAFHNISNTLSKLVSDDKNIFESFVNIFSGGGLSTGLFCEYYGITEEEYKAFCEQQDYYKQTTSKIEAIRTQIKNGEAVDENDLCLYADALWELHFGDYRNNKVFYNEYFDADKCKDLTLLPSDSCNHISLYHTIDHRLLEYVGAVNTMEFRDKFGGSEDFNIVKFVEYFDIDKEEYKSIIEKYSAESADDGIIYLVSPFPYPIDYLYGDEAAQKLCFEVHKLK